MRVPVRLRPGPAAARACCELVLVFLGLGLLTGCQSKFKLAIESDTAWVATIHGRQITGFWSQTIDVTDDVPVCVTVRSTTSTTAYIDVRLLVVDSMLMIQNEGELDRATGSQNFTTPRLYLTVCSRR